jgi:hypothetical protein
MYVTKVSSKQRRLRGSCFGLFGESASTWSFCRFLDDCGILTLPGISCVSLKSGVWLLFLVLGISISTPSFYRFLGDSGTGDERALLSCASRRKVAAL